MKMKQIAYIFDVPGIDQVQIVEEPVHLSNVSHDSDINICDHLSLLITHDILP
jgi:hypothetical protein